MPARTTRIEETQIIKDILRQLRRHRSNAIAQSPQPAKDRLVIATNGQPATWQLTSIPATSALGSSVNLSLNGQELDEATDYSVDYTSGLVTFSSGQQALFKATPTPADVLTADYWTTGDLIAASTLADFGGPYGDPTSFQILSNTATLGAATPTLFPGDHYAAWAETGRTLNDVTAVVSAIPFGGIYVCCSIGHTNANDVWWIGAAIGTGFIGQTVHASAGAGAGGAMVGTPATPFTVRAAVNGSGLLSIWVNGTLAGTFDVATNVPTAWTDLQGATKVGFIIDSSGNALDSWQTTDGVWADSFNRANQQGLGSLDTGQAWSYNP